MNAVESSLGSGAHIVPSLQGQAIDPARYCDRYCRACFPAKAGRRRTRLTAGPVSNVNAVQRPPRRSRTCCLGFMMETVP